MWKVRCQLSPLHEAVIDDNVAAVKAHSANVDLLSAHDPLGFTALELALLLNRTQCLHLLDGKRRELAVDTLLQGHDEQQQLSALQFTEAFGCAYLPVMAFADYAHLRQTVKRCPWWPKSQRSHDHILYRNEIWNGVVAPIQVRWIDSIIGYGLFTSQELPAAAFVATYTGFVRRITRREKESHTYCFHYPSKWCCWGCDVIDSLYGGNVMRFANHSDIPNMRPCLIYDRGLQHIAFLTLEPVAAGMQLTFNYGPDYWKQRTRV